MTNVLISENEKNRILDLHIQELLSEQIRGNGTNARPAQQSFGINDKIDGSLFKNGIDSIDTENQQYKTVVEKLKKLPAGTTVSIIGGASAVGSGSGYDNKALASRRAANFIASLKQFGIDTNGYKIQTQIGVATQKNSPEANAEQFVKIQTKGKDVNVSAIDNTAVRQPTNIVPGSGPNGIPLKKWATIKVPADHLDKIKEILRKNGYKI